MTNESNIYSGNDMDMFREKVYRYYHEHGRRLPWRETSDPYRITVSEFMLQQTQVDRVLNKYPAFIKRFPAFQMLANAELRDVIAAWQGLGYNRRAKMLHDTAKTVMEQFEGTLPEDPETLRSLPGIGAATSCEIAAFAFNHPVVFIETNIRSVFIHEFFSDNTEVHDRDIMPLIEQALDRDKPREWYYALMDYGVMIKREHGNPSRRSRHHQRQSRFDGSDRQIRGAILRMLTDRQELPISVILYELDAEEARIREILTRLAEEGMVEIRGETVSIP